LPDEASPKESGRERTASAFRCLSFWQLALPTVGVCASVFWYYFLLAKAGPSFGLEACGIPPLVPVLKDLSLFPSPLAFAHNVFSALQHIAIPARDPSIDMSVASMQV